MYVVIGVGCVECSPYGGCDPEVEFMTTSYEEANNFAKSSSKRGGHSGDAFVLKLSDDPKIVSFMGDEGYEDWREKGE